ncbi:alpha/beta hydrolase [Clostridium sardiniense]|uniref:Alpha/beta hydrolase n=1 Tax=Clostridium sardiniense TaxID=29369 RepID=A0ABS7KYN6_CLOSR|nr:alpha/beta hydrolase [Clostridium sardiniense]MBY0755935.1 alpha/beta hydrolase [Clostridium sardiniense]MDQ0461335.1 fermentation-respiration switch protein FrsA (DUF1100 family) [Clostridium sardiniense]
MKIIISILVVIIILLGGVLGFVGNYFYNLALNPHMSKDAIFGATEEASSDAVSQDETSGETRSEDLEWLLAESDYKDKYVKSNDGLKLHSYEVRNTKKTNNWVVVVHGYTSEGKQMSSFAKPFYDMGYNVLIPDLRGHGKSEGDYIGMGWDDRLDIIKWIDHILEEDKNANIVLHGVSMGAATVMMTAGEELPSNVKAIIEDCGYTSAWDEFSYQLKALFKLPSFPVMNAASIVSKIRAGYWLGEGSAIKQVAKSKTPMLFIHGDADDFVPYFMLDELYNAATSEKERLVIEGAGHAKAATVNPELYWDTIKKFIDKNI